MFFLVMFTKTQMKIFSDLIIATNHINNRIHQSQNYNSMWVNDLTYKTSYEITNLH